MISTMFLCGAMLVGMPAADEPPAKPPDLDAYTAARGKAG